MVAIPPTSVRDYIKPSAILDFQCLRQQQQAGWQETKAFVAQTECGNWLGACQNWQALNVAR